MNSPRLLLTRDDCAAVCRDSKRAGRTIALVPTMGYLHVGHEALLRRGRALADILVATIFVNPTQFGPGEDLERYPRDLEGDLELCRSAGVDLVFAPADPAEMYPPGFQTRVTVEEVTRHFCGAKRPGHFRGVTTVVAKLFNLVGPDFAVFGEKDYQQLVTIRTMVRDLDMGIEIVGLPTVREADGLALSSRNAMLGREARARAVCLVEGIRKAQAAFENGERRADALTAACRDVVERGADSVDYVCLADPVTLEISGSESLADADSRLLVAACIEGVSGRVRLIDNAALGLRV